MKSSRVQQLQQILPATPGIVGREEYTVSAILVPLLSIDGEEHLLFEKRASHIRQGGEICFPGGHFDAEQDADYLETALRETREELGLQQSDIELVGRLDTLVSPRGIIVECFLAALDSVDVTDLTLDRDEVDEVFTAPLRWFAENPPEIYHTRIETQSSYVDGEGNLQVLLPVEQLGLPGRYINNRSEWIRRVMVYRWNHHIIWGLTGSVVENLVNTLYGGTRQ